jgi:hypothetical protein
MLPSTSSAEYTKEDWVKNTCSYPAMYDMEELMLDKGLSIDERFLNIEKAQASYREAQDVYLDCKGKTEAAFDMELERQHQKYLASPEYALKKKAEEKEAKRILKIEKKCASKSNRGNTEYTAKRIYNNCINEHFN